MFNPLGFSPNPRYPVLRQMALASKPLFYPEVLRQQVRLGFLLFFTVAAFARDPVPGSRDYVVDTWQAEDGLPQNSVTALAQTRDGYLWVGTQDGMARFDGVRFVTFHALNTPAIHNSRIVQVFEDRRGALWVATEAAGLVRLERGQFTAFNAPHRGTAYNYARVLCDDAKGGLWMATCENQLVRWHDGEFAVPSTNWSLAGTSVRGVAGDRTGEVWVGTDEELAVWRDGAFKVMWGRQQEEGFGVEWLAASHAGGCWVVANGRVRRFQGGKWAEDLGAYAWTNRVVYGLHEDRHGQVWVATMGDGLFRYGTNGAVLRLTTREGLPTDLIRCVTEDREGNIWVGTEGGGLCRLKPAIFQTYAREQGLSSDQIQAVHEDQEGALWIGTNGDGLDRMKDGKVDLFGLAQGLANGHVWSVLRDRQGLVWVGTWDGLFRGEQGQFVRASDNVIIGGSVTALYEDSQETLWVGQQTLGGLACWRNGRPAAVTIPGMAASRDVRALAEDSDGALWIGTNGDGLYRIKAGQFTRFGIAEGLGSETIWSLLADSDGTIWIGTAHGGLSRWRHGIMTTCTTRQGLVNDVICQIFDDHQGYLWLGSHGGVFRLRKDELDHLGGDGNSPVQCLSFGKADGLPTIECSGGFQPSGCQSRDGRLWFPTVKGLAVLDPAKVRINPVPPPVVIEDALVDEVVESLDRSTTGPYRSQASSPGQSAPVSARLRVGPGKQRFEFRFTGLSLTSPQKVRFRYKLEGLDGKWTDAGMRRVAHYGYLPPGDYCFRVTACNNDGIWNQEGDALALAVLPYFWQTGWFRVSAAGLLLAVTALLAQQVSTRRLQLKLRRVEQERALERERTRIARDIHDDLGARLTKIGMLTAQAERQALSADTPPPQLREIALTAREMVQAMDATVWAVNPRNDTFDHLANYLVQYVQEFFRYSHVVCRLDLPAELPDWPVSAEVRHNVFLVVKEALNNVARHADASEVGLELHLTNSTLCIAVRDNGHGFSPGKPPQRGNGLQNMAQRLQQLGGCLRVESAPGAGACITLELKLRAEDAAKGV
jgi:ligand-binding sensor domain-containing protein/signal transduction histidine kinase